MCGIAGVLEFEAGARPSGEGLARMARILAHRGPDAEGCYQSGPAGFAHTRLSIIDLVSGDQPMESPDRRVCVIFNGEIYNYPELRRELESQRYEFRTRSDTEVLLALYLRDGLDAFSHLNGMFACAFWDRDRRQIVLARDRFGKKPLFYHVDSRRFLFGSEIKALLAYGGLERRVNPHALHEYLTYGYIVGNHTIFEGIRRVPPAHRMVVGADRLELDPYWRLEFQPTTEPVDEREAAERVAVLLRQAVKRRLLSDVPLGAFLSGGVDSSTIVALMAELSDHPVRTFSIGFEEAEYSELEDARRVAKHVGTDHHELIVKPAAMEVLPDLVWHLDEPFGDSSAVPTYYVCRAAREHVTVALSGDGGDEVFAGYARYRQLDRHGWVRRIPASLRRRLLEPLTGILPFTAPGWNYLYALARVPGPGLPVGLGLYPYIGRSLISEELRAWLAGTDPSAETSRIVAQAGHLDPVSRHQYLDTLQYLPADILTKVDRMSMANSLEVRSPLLDHTLVEYMATLPASLKLRDGVSKYLFRKAFGPLLPSHVWSKRKQGFGIPQGQWFRRELRASAKEILLDDRTLARGYVRPEAVTRLLRHHVTGRRDYSGWIWCLIVLEMWCRLFMDGPFEEHAPRRVSCLAGSPWN
jgi:asparagine synthase (glutamine-hydrolysing)